MEDDEEATLDDGGLYVFQDMQASKLDPLRLKAESRPQIHFGRPNWRSFTRVAAKSRDQLLLFFLQKNCYLLLSGLGS